MCIAVRVEPLFAAIKLPVTLPEVIKALEASPSCRKSQQKFLHPKCMDTAIKKARRGLGGNSTTQHCVIIAQAVLDESHLENIRQGIAINFFFESSLNTHLFSSIELTSEPADYFHTPQDVMTAPGQSNEPEDHASR